jgi:hemoglobin/transferrin/lactoferrin receptor protein
MGVVFTLSAQIITIKDQQTGSPLEAVVLSGQGVRTTAITNTVGQADISSFKGFKTILVRCLGFKTLELTYNQIEALNFEIFLEHTSMHLDQVVVSATRWAQSSRNVPTKIIAITPEEVALQNPQTAADLLGISGQVFIQKSQQGGGSPMIRGFATNRLIYSVDGVRMNTAIFRGGNLQNVINLDPFAIKNTEVLFGPGSVIYGSDAIGGVMSFQTLTPQFTQDEKPLVTGKVITRYASANHEKTGHADISLGWKKWAMVTSISYWDYDHLRQGSHGPDDYLKGFHPQRIDGQDVLVIQEDPLLQIPSGYTQFNLMQKVRFKPNEHWDFQYGFHYSATSSYGRYDRHNRLRNGLPRYGEWDYGPQKWSMHHASLSHEKSNLIYDQMTLRIALQAFEESRISRDFNAFNRDRRIEQVDVYSANFDFTKNTSSRNTLYYGVEYVLNEVLSTGTNEILFSDQSKPDSIIRGSSTYPNATWQSMALYINDEFRVSNRFTLQVGMRYNRITMDSDFTNNADFFPFTFNSAQLSNGALTGSLGAVYRPSDTWVIKANLGTAFRSPNVDDIGKVFDSEPGAVVVPNPDLTPEYAYNVDLGIARIFFDKVKVNITGFYTLLDNAMVRRDFQLNGLDSIVYDGLLSRVQAIQNAAVATVYGLQAGIEIKLPAGFSFISDISYQVGEEELDDGTISPSRHAAPLFGVSRLRYQTRDLTLELNTFYQGERRFENLAQEERRKDEIYAKDSNGNNYSPSWYTLNFKMRYQFMPLFHVSGGVENLTDQRYRPYSSGLSGAGRSFILSLGASF